MAEVKQKALKDLLESRSILKQDVFDNTKATFEKFSAIISESLNELRVQVPDERVRLNVKEKSGFDKHVYIGSDVLVFNMHSNVFRFPDDNPIWKTSYLTKNREFGYCGIINIYNFLADSFLQGRLHDPGYLIGRIFVNKENHFIVEGKGQLGFLFRDLMNSELTADKMKQIVEIAFAHAIEFDLLAPPYEAVSTVNVMQMKALSSNLQLKTGKRLGFKFQAEEDKNLYI